MSAQTCSAELYRILDDERKEFLQTSLAGRSICSDAIQIARWPVAHTFAATARQPHHSEPARLQQQDSIAKFIALPTKELARADKLCQIVILDRENTTAPLNVTKEALDKITEVCPSRWELRTLLVRQIKGFKLSDFPSADFAPVVYRPFNKHNDKRLTFGSDCEGFGESATNLAAARANNPRECIYGFGYLGRTQPVPIPHDNRADGINEIAGDWVVRRSLLYHYHVQNSTTSRSYSLFILVAAQKHVEDCLVNFFKQTAATVGGSDPFNAHVALHHHCLGQWPFQIDRISKELRDDYNKLIVQGLEKTDGSQSPEASMETWFKECQTTIDLADRLDMALRAAEAVEAVLQALIQHHSTFGRQPDDEKGFTGQASVVSLLLEEQIAQSKSVRDQLATSQVKAERIATVYSRLSQIQVEQHSAFAHSLKVHKDAIEKQTKNSTEMARTLTLLGALFLPANLLANIAGISKGDVATGGNWGYWMIGVLAGPVLLYGIIKSYVSLMAKRQKEKDKKGCKTDEEHQVTGQGSVTSCLGILSKDLW